MEKEIDQEKRLINREEDWWTEKRCNLYTVSKEKGIDKKKDYFIIIFSEVL